MEESGAISRHHLSSLKITENPLGALWFWQAQFEISKEGSSLPEKIDEKQGLLDVYQPYWLQQPGTS